MSLRQELAQYYRWLRQYGLNDSHSGNASVRNGEKVWITPTGACADLIGPEHLVKCRLGQRPPEQASLDAPLHLAVYEKNPRAQAILHSHCPYSIAITLHGNAFKPDDFEGQYYFSHIPLIDIPYERYVMDSPALVSAALAESPIAIVRGHGVYAQAESLELAYKWTCTLESSAKTSFLARLAGGKGKR
jgi:L-fuculose-phosphate aldolase